MPNLLHGAGTDSADNCNSICRDGLCHIPRLSGQLRCRQSIFHKQCLQRSKNNVKSFSHSSRPRKNVISPRVYISVLLQLNRLWLKPRLTVVGTNRDNYNPRSDIKALMRGQRKSMTIFNKRRHRNWKHEKENQPRGDLRRLTELYEEIWFETWNMSLHHVKGDAYEIIRAYGPTFLENRH